jgi:Flp pilus assembly protein CpaB
MLRPGNRVDLAAHFEYRAQAQGQAISEVKVFLQDILVLASGRTIQTEPPKGVDQSIVRGILASSLLAQSPEPGEVRDTLNYAKTDTIFQTVTLEVTPQQAQAIVYVMSVYADSIILLLRHSDDRQLARTQTTNLYDVMGNDSYLIRKDKLPPPQAIPKVRFYDYIGDQRVPVTGGQ